jgi:hypothetical protein
MIDGLDFDNLVTVLTSVVTIASFITGFTDTPKDDGVVKKLYKVIEFFAIVNAKTKQK